MAPYLIHAYAAVASQSVAGMAAADALLSRRPSLTLLMLSASLFGIAALLQKALRPRTAEKTRSAAALDNQEETSA